jgi:sugar/nucleoside kinase (ribokinase family)
VIGNLNVDLIMRGLDELPLWGQEVSATGRVEVSSGQAGYLAMALARLGVSVTVIGNVGADESGARLLVDLSQAGAWTDDVERSVTAATGLSVALVRCDGERAFVSEFGCLREFDEAMVRRHAGAFARARIVCFVGVFNLPSFGLDATTQLAAEARERGQVVMVDTGWDPHGWPPATVAAARELVAATDLLLVSDAESQALTGLADVREAASVLADWGAATVVIKCGSRGAHGRDARVVCDVPAMSTTVSDTVGAGDTFNAGLLVGCLESRNIVESIALGNAAAGLYCSREHARFPLANEVRDIAHTLLASASTSASGQVGSEGRVLG